MKISKRLLPVFFLLFFGTAFCQLPYRLVDGRQHKYCEGCLAIVNDMPKEVLFGLQINSNGDIFFSMNNRAWFDKIFKNNSYGVTIDLVSEDRYSCEKNATDAFEISLPVGKMLEPIYRQDLLEGTSGFQEGSIFTQIGKLPPSLKNKKVEGNLVIVNGNYICYYTNFVNLDRGIWKLLPMGLFTDSVIHDTEGKMDGQSDLFTYSKKLQVEIPFAKGSSDFSGSYLSNIYSSLELSKFNIRKIEVRAYSSVEGSEKINRELLSRRADTIIQALKLYEPTLQRIKVITAENWLDFYTDISSTEFSSFQNLPKREIKEKLSDRSVAKSLESMLEKHRKGVVTFYLEPKTASSNFKDSSLFSEFKKAVSEKNIGKARDLQKEVVERVMDNRLPLDYINRLEVPRTKDFSALLNDREVYKYLLKATDEYEALDNFLALKQLDPANGKINYNICALRFFMWQYGGDSSIGKLLLKEITLLPAQGIDSMLVKRLIVNYHILKCEDNMRVFNYEGKDSSLNVIHNMYGELNLNDNDIYSLAKYYASYSRQDWAEEIIQPRIDRTDVNEDLVFYYLNLLFFSPGSYYDESFNKAVLNAINLNNKRFCNFFLPNDRGGASMQLLEYEEIKDKYCEECKR